MLKSTTYYQKCSFNIVNYSFISLIHLFVWLKQLSTMLIFYILNQDCDNCLFAYNIYLPTTYTFHNQNTLFSCLIWAIKHSGEIINHKHWLIQCFNNWNKNLPSEPEDGFILFLDLLSLHRTISKSDWILWGTIYQREICVNGTNNCLITLFLFILRKNQIFWKILYFLIIDFCWWLKVNAQEEFLLVCQNISKFIRLILAWNTYNFFFFLYVCVLIFE